MRFTAVVIALSMNVECLWSSFSRKYAKHEQFHIFKYDIRKHDIRKNPAKIPQMCMFFF